MEQGTVLKSSKVSATVFSGPLYEGIIMNVELAHHPCRIPSRISGSDCQGARSHATDHSHAKGLVHNVAETLQSD